MATPGSQTARLTRDSVLHEAIALLDAEGADALTMRRLADRLGVVPMALYRHVANREDLIRGALDLAVSFVALPAPGLPWRDGLGQLARAIRTTVLAHPAIAGPLVSTPSLGPNGVSLGQYGHTLLQDAGYDELTALRATNAIVTYTLGFVALEVPRLRADKEILEAEFVSDAQFEFGLRCILDGVDALRPTKRRPTKR